MWSDFYKLLKFKFATGDVFTVKIWGRMNNTKLELKGPNFDVWGSNTFLSDMFLPASALKDVIIKYVTGFNATWMLLFQPWLCDKIWFNYKGNPEFSSTVFLRKLKLLCEIQQERKMNNKYDLFPIVSLVNWRQHTNKQFKVVKESKIWLSFLLSSGWPIKSSSLNIRIMPQNNKILCFWKFSYEKLI